MLALGVALQLCAATPAAGVVAAAGHTPYAATVAAGPGGIAVTWLEARAPVAGFGGDAHRRQVFAMARTFDRTTLAATSDATEVDRQPAADAFQNGAAALATSEGGLYASVCHWAAFAGDLACHVRALGRAPAMARAEWHASVPGPGPTDAARVAASMSAVGSTAVLLLPSATSLYVLASGTHGQPEFLLHGASDDDASRRIDAPALAPAGAGRMVAAWRRGSTIVARLAGVEGRGHGGAVPLSAVGTLSGAPTVAWLGNGRASVVYASRADANARWHLVLAQWTPDTGEVTRTDLPTGPEDAMAPSIVPGADPGCAVVSWTQGQGHGTHARAGRLCGGVLDAGSVAPVSTTGVEAGDTELASDGVDVFVVWQEIPAGASPLLRLARVGCH